MQVGIVYSARHHVNGCNKLNLLLRIYQQLDIDLLIMYSSHSVLLLVCIKLAYAQTVLAVYDPSTSHTIVG